MRQFWCAHWGPYFFRRLISFPHSLLTAFPPWDSPSSSIQLEPPGTHSQSKGLHWSPCLGSLSRGAHLDPGQAVDIPTPSFRVSYFHFWRCNPNKKQLREKGAYFISQLWSDPIADGSQGRDFRQRVMALPCPRMNAHRGTCFHSLVLLLSSLFLCSPAASA